MKKRLLKVLSVPVILVALLIPLLLISAVIWIIRGDEPLSLFIKYIDWLYD